MSVIQKEKIEKERKREKLRDRTRHKYTNQCATVEHFQWIWQKFNLNWMFCAFSMCPSFFYTLFTDIMYTICSTHWYFVFVRKKDLWKRHVLVNRKRWPLYCGLKILKATVTNNSQLTIPYTNNIYIYTLFECWMEYSLSKLKGAYESFIWRASESNHLSVYSLLS